MSLTELKSILSLNFGNSCSHGFRGGWRSRQFSCCHGRWSRPRRQMRKAEALSYDAMLDTPPRPPRARGDRGLNCDLPYKLNVERGRERGSKRDDSAGDEDVAVALRPSPPLPLLPVGGRGDRPRMRRRRRRRRHCKPYHCSVCVYCADVEARATPTGSYDSFSLFTSFALIMIVTVLLVLFFRCLVLGCALIFLRKFPPQFQLPQMGTENYSSGSIIVGLVRQG